MLQKLLEGKNLMTGRKTLASIVFLRFLQKESRVKAGWEYGGTLEQGME